MKTQVKLFFLISSLLFTNALFAGSKVGIVNIDVIMRESTQSKAIRSKLQNEFKGRQNTFNATQANLKTAFEQFKRNKEVLSEAEKRKKEKEIQRLQRDLQRQQQELAVDSSTREQEEIQGFLEKIRKVVDQVAKAEKYDVILAGQATLFNAKGTDITQKVLKKLEGNKKPKQSKA